MPASILTTLAYRRRPAWVERTEILDPAGLPAKRLVRELLTRAPRHSVVVLNGSLRVEQAAATLLARRPGGPALVLADATWVRGESRAERTARRLAARALDGRRVHYCVLSSGELHSFPASWGVDPERVHFTPFHWVYSEEQLALPVSADGGVFAGGNSLRDYGPLLGVAGSLDAPVTVATNAAPPHEPAANLRVGPLPPDGYEREFRRARVVVVPLAAREDRSAGQQTYLNAMVLGKPVIVTDVLGARDYVEDRATGLIVPPGDPHALREALAWVLDPGNAEEVAALAERGRRAALERFGPDAYAQRLLEVADAAAASR